MESLSHTHTLQVEDVSSRRGGVLEVQLPYHAHAVPEQKR